MYRINSSGQPTVGGLPSRVVECGATTLRIRNILFYEHLTKGSELDAFFVTTGSTSYVNGAVGPECWLVSYLHS